jgi:chromosomal replication initiator protein
MILPDLKQMELEEMQRNQVSNNQIMEMIISTVSDYLGVDPIYCLKKSRKREHVYLRQLCMFFIYKNTSLSLKSIGERFGGRDHTTVIHNNTLINGFIDIKDDKVLNDITNIKKLYATLYGTTSHNKLY